MAQQVEQLRADGVYKEVIREGTGPLPDFRDGTKVRIEPLPLGAGAGVGGPSRTHRSERRMRREGYPPPAAHTLPPSPW